MFRSVSNKGFQVTFENGWTVSVQFGSGNYCDARDYSLPFGAEQGKSEHECKSAETAVWGPDGKFVQPLWHDQQNDDVQGWQSPADVLKLMAWAADK
jgi:hypothetical protein